jgi:hypothetical protein
VTNPTVESLEAQVAELTARLERLSPTPVRPKVESVERYLEMALTRMQGEPDPVKAAAALFLAWCQQDSTVAKSLDVIVEEVIERRLAAIPRPTPELA